MNTLIMQVIKVLHLVFHLLLMNLNMVNAIQQVFAAIRDDLSIRAVIIRGEGGTFCAGGDIAAWSSWSADEFGRHWVRDGHIAFDALARLSQPVIAVLNGHCLGGGLELAACADYRIAEAHVKLGQPVPTLSGGEAQRIKIAAHLTSQGGERVLYILDEPTTGLHFDDIAKLLAAFRKLLEAGHTLLVIEHNLDVIKTADYLIDLGPEGGDAGGAVVATGTPEQVASNGASHTGEALRAVLAQARARESDA